MHRSCRCFIIVEEKSLAATRRPPVCYLHYCVGRSGFLSLNYSSGVSLGRREASRGGTRGGEVGLTETFDPCFVALRSICNLEPVLVTLGQFERAGLNS